VGFYIMDRKYEGANHVRKTLNLSKYQKGVYYSGIKIFNHLPQNIKNLSCKVKKFKLALKRFLLMGSFYSLDEYFDWISRSDLGTFT
jgi:hypothetical protein